MDIPITFPQLAGDFSFALIFFAITLGVGFFLGRTRLIYLMIDVYIARALVSVIPGDWISLVSYSDTIIFLLVFAFLFFTDHRLFDLHIPSRASGFFLRVIVMGVLITGMITSSVFNYLPKEMVLEYVSVTLYSYFVSEWAQMFWMIMPLIVLAFINKKRD
jgi:hypothetical protein